MGYDVVGEIDQVGDAVRGFTVGDRVADMTVIGSNAAYRTLRADHLTRVPPEVDAAEAATLILSWMTAYQLLHRAAHVQSGQRVLVHGAAGAVGQALLVLGKQAGLQVWGAARGEHAALVRELGATPIDYKREEFTRAVPGGFDVVFDGIGEDGYRRSFAALKPGGLLLAIGFSAGVQAKQGMLSILMAIARLYLWGLLPGGKHARFYSINVMRARHPDWFREDLERLFGLLATHAIQPDEEVDHPRQLQQDDRDCLHARQEGVLQPQRCERHKKRDVGEPQEVGRPVVGPVDRHKDADERGIQDLQPERNPPGPAEGTS